MYKPSSHWGSWCRAKRKTRNALLRPSASSSHWSPTSRSLIRFCQPFQPREKRKPAEADAPVNRTFFFGWWRHFLSHINRHSWDCRKPPYYNILRCHVVQFWKTMVMRDRSRGMRDQMSWKRTSRDWKWKIREPPINGGFSSKPCFIAGG